MAKKRKSLENLAEINVPVHEAIVPVVTLESIQQDILDQLQYHKAAVDTAKQLSKALALHKKMETTIGIDIPDLPGAISLAKSLEQALYHSGPVAGVFLPALPENHPWWAKYRELKKAIQDKT